MKTTQRGMVLIFSLMVLLALTLLSVSAMDNAFTAQRMARNDLNLNIAFQRADALAHHAEQQLAQLNWQNELEPRFGLQPGYYHNGTQETDLFVPAHWHADHNCINDPAHPQHGCYKVELIAYRPPLQIGDYQQPQAATVIAQISSRGLDEHGHSSAIIQTHFQFQPAP